MNIKRYISILIAVLFFVVPFKVEALSKEEAAESLNDWIENYLTNEEWRIESSPNSTDTFNVYVDLAPETDGDFDEIMKKIPTLSAFNKKAFKSYTQVIKCSDESNCDNTITNMMNFQLVKENAKYSLKADFKSKTDVEAITKSTEPLHYKIVTTESGLLGDDIERTGSFIFENDVNDENLDKQPGKISNPAILTPDGTLTIPEISSSFWAPNESNYCYYFKVDFSSLTSSTFARYQIQSIDKVDIQAHIYWGNNPQYTLASNIVEDALEKGIFGLSLNNYYAICGAEDTEITFTYHDDQPLNVGNHLQQGEVENQNGGNNGGNSGNNQGFTPVDPCENGGCDITLTNFCYQKNVARTLKFAGLVFFLLKIFIPTLIIVMGFVNLFQIITSGKEDQAKKYAGTIVKRVFIGVGIFLIPGIIQFLFETAKNIIDTPTVDSFDNCMGCLFDPNDSTACDISGDKAN